jgi:Tfp pilus assembly protein PilN
MRPLNLIPPEERRGDSAPLRAGALSYVVVAALAVGLIAVTTMVLTSNKINDSRSQLASLQVRDAAAKQAAQSLAPYGNFATLTENRSTTVSDLARSRFDWERVLRELALVIPEDVTLQSLTGSAAASSGASGGPTDSTITGPSLQISGCAGGQEGTARLLAALRDIDGVTRVGMQSSALSDSSSSTAAPAAGASTGCDSLPDAATFQITVAFDAVPTAAEATTGTTATPAATTTTPSATTAPTSNDGGVAQTEAQQTAATDSAATQTRRATDRANNVGVGK